ncbi:ral guanine nucleotide dissociation stimulator-like [Canis lupus dingo]|uniref:ral guanine nucleotide dissociation stimulator-like n=1 Tax=Canis lupus dingo TaxID=286419 RepID=UPI0020C55635|nr:ral guanine nucleotide dissociation stimulator-like [Canis lupus dingo]
MDTPRKNMWWEDNPYATGKRQTIPDGHNGFSGVETREEWKVASEPRYTSWEDLEEPPECGCFEWWSCWCDRQTQRLREFFRRCRRSLQSSTWEIRSAAREYECRWKRKEKIRHTPGSSTSSEDLQGLKAERASALRKNRIFPTTPSRRELLEQQVEELVPALLCLDDLSIVQFMETYPEFGTTEEILDLLFAKYRCIQASPEKGEIQMLWESTMTSFLTIWLTYYEEDFDDPPEFPALTKLMNFTGQYLPDSTLDRRVNSYSEYLRNLHQAEFQGGDDTVSSDREQHREPPQERARASTEGPAPPSGSQGMELVLADAAEGSAQALMPAAVYKVRHVMVRPLHPCADPEEPPAPLGALEAERAPPPAIEVINGPEQPPHSGEQPASDPEQHPEPPRQEPARGRLWGLLHLQGLRGWSWSRLLKLRVRPEP